MRFSAEIKLMMRGSLLLLPFALVFAYAMYMLYQSGEILSAEKAMQLQQKGEKVLFSPAYSYPVKYYKNKRYATEEAPILVLGSSRVMQLRSEFFRNPEQVYNAGGVVNKVRFLNLFAGQWKMKPRVILLGIDYWWFNQNFDDLRHKQFDDDLKHNTRTTDVILSSWQTILKDLYNGKANHKKITSAETKQRFGLLSKMKNEGFRPDGSYQYSPEYEQQNIQERFRSDIGNFVRRQERHSSFNAVNEPAVLELEKFIRYCKQQNIQLIAFGTPNSKQINDSLKAHAVEFEGFFQSQYRLQELFDAYGICYFDYAHNYGMFTDDEMIDGMHGSEKVYGKILLDMSHHCVELNEFCDTTYIKQKMQKSVSQFNVFPYY